VLGTSSEVLICNEHDDLAHGRAYCRRLLDFLEAIAILLNHLLQSANLAFNPPQAI